MYVGGSGTAIGAGAVSPRPTLSFVSGPGGGGKGLVRNCSRHFFQTLFAGRADNLQFDVCCMEPGTGPCQARGIPPSLSDLANRSLR